MLLKEVVVLYMHNVVEFNGEVQDNVVVDQRVFSRIIIIRNVLHHLGDQNLLAIDIHHRIPVEKMT